MTLQQTDVDDLTVVPVPTPSVWLPGSPENGVDDRLELARLGPAGAPENLERITLDPADPADPNLAAADLAAVDRIAVREARHPSGPGLLFTLPEWNSLLGREPDLVDLR